MSPARGMALLVLFSHRRLSVLTIGSVDWVFALLFLAAYFAIKSDRAAV
jgi:hypothetical protein